MATYAIGDIQGCLTSLENLLNHIAFNPSRDRLWLVGDLVNRGPDSLGVMRFVKNLGSSCIMVLGNHDIHLLAIHAGITSEQKNDTLQPILKAPDCDELVGWLRQQPLFYQESPYILVHAGILPQWSMDHTRELAGEVEAALQSECYQDSLATLYRSHTCKWKEDLLFEERIGFTTNVLTRMRVCSSEGQINLSFKDRPERTPPGYSPWFLHPAISPRSETIIFGHWSALGTYITDQYVGIDDGCIWGHNLVAFRLEDRKTFSSPCTDQEMLKG